MNKRAFLLIFLIIIIAVIAIYYFFALKKQENEIQSAYPSYFPKGMVTDAYISHLEVLSEKAKLPWQSKQASVSYKSYRNLEENLVGFTSYFEKNGFGVEVTPNKESGVFYIEAKKDSESVNVSLFNRNPIQVSILYFKN